MDWTKLTIAQEMADKGEFAKVTSCFVQWLSPRLTNVREAMWEQKFRRRRESEPNGVHMRTPENLNALRFGLMTFLEFTQSVGAISQREAEGLIDRAAEAFLKLLRSAITMGRAYLAAPNGAAPDGNRSFGWYIPTGCREKESRGVKVGWVKGDDIFLLPDAARAVAHKLAQDQGEILPGSVETIKRDLKEQGLLARFDEKRRTITVRRTLEGEQQDVLVISYDTFQRTSCETADNADIADEQSLN
jgi:hypothetical protein